ncbi:CCA tRNA nucleotidyltransferase [Candidatus Poribacteria bacterium]|nr:CCA tRNA nucleotidyltransferase [Candidatus Poribacteria bacterium]
MELHIPEPLSTTLHEIGDVAGENAYLVGGSVRDLILKRENLDIDIVVVGDGIQLATEMYRQWKGKIQVYQQFGTACVTPENPDKPKVDFVTARCETYNKAGTLPKVVPGSITDDLYRRDFTINALAMHIDTPNFGTVIDKVGGIEDLNSGTIQVLHEKSYTDDPTRIFRAFRYAVRYNFNITESDYNRIKDALQYIKEISGERIRNEIDRVLLESTAPQILNELVNTGIFTAISPHWKIPPSFAEDFQLAQQAISWSSEYIEKDNISSNIILWMTLFGIQDNEGIPAYILEYLCFRLVLGYKLEKIAEAKNRNLPKISTSELKQSHLNDIGVDLSQNTSMEHYNGKWCIIDKEKKKTFIYEQGVLYKIISPIAMFQSLYSVLNSLNDTVPTSEIYRILKTYPLEALVLSLSYHNQSRVQQENIKEYLLNLRYIQPIINGNDLIQWGEKPGKNFDSILKNIFSKQLDGIISSKSEAYTYYINKRDQ